MYHIYYGQNTNNFHEFAASNNLVHFTLLKYIKLMHICVIIAKMIELYVESVSFHQNPRGQIFAREIVGTR